NCWLCRRAVSNPRPRLAHMPMPMNSKNGPDLLWSAMDALPSHWGQVREVCGVGREISWAARPICLGILTSPLRQASACLRLTSTDGLAVGAVARHRVAGPFDQGVAQFA